MQLTQTNAVFSKIALVSCFCAEFQLSSSAKFENATDSFDDASTMLDESGSLGSFLDATIARTKQLGNTTVTPASSPESREYPNDDLDDAYVELDDDFIY
jgi:hypothetical protein